MGHKRMLSCFAEVVPCRDIVICPKSHSKLKTGIRSSLDNHCSSLHLTGFLSVLPRGQETFFFIEQKQRCFSKYCEILESRFVVLPLGGQELLLYINSSICLREALEEFSTEVTCWWLLFHPTPGTGNLAPLGLSRRISGAFQVEIPLSLLGHGWISRLRREINLLFIISPQLGLILESGL